MRHKLILKMNIQQLTESYPSSLLVNSPAYKMTYPKLYTASLVKYIKASTTQDLFIF